MKFKSEQSKQKLRGGYYTPLDLAEFISKWSLEGDVVDVLEPSCGDGVFIDAVSEAKVREINFLGVEREPEEAKKARNKKVSNNIKTIKIITADFFDWVLNPENKKKYESSFDAVIGNPPFIRYQFLDKQDKEYSEQIFNLNGLKFTKHTNAWVPFVISSINLLRPGGKLGMIIPAEILHVTHSNELRRFLIQECSEINIIDPMDIWFEGTLQGVVILFAKKKTSSDKETKGVKVKRVKGKTFTKNDPIKMFEAGRYTPKSMLGGKWITALLNKQEIDLIEKIKKLEGVKSFNEIANVAVGIVTGANDFFLVNDNIVNQYKLNKYSYPMFGRSNHCKGVIYDQEVHSKNSKNGLPTNFIWFKEKIKNKKSLAYEYINLGEDQQLHKRYKCRIRDPWYAVPSVYSTKLAMLKRSNNTPRLIYNQMEAYTTDTAYRLESKISEQKLCFCFINPFTALLAELEGRSYGGGVLELVPSEIRKLYIPVPTENFRYNLKKLDNDFKKNKDIDLIMEEQSRKVLGNIGISEREQAILLKAYKKIRLRRKKES